MIGLGNGALPEAMSDAQRAAELGIVEWLHPGPAANLAVHARTLLANGRLAEAHARVDEVLASRS